MPPMASQEARTAAVKAAVYSAGEFCVRNKSQGEKKKGMRRILWMRTGEASRIHSFIAASLRRQRMASRSGKPTDAIAVAGVALRTNFRIACFATSTAVHRCPQNK